MRKIYIKRCHAKARPVVEAYVQDGNGKAVDLSGNDTSVTFSMWQIESATPKLDAVAAVIANPQIGLVQYAWQAGDVDTAGLFVGEFKVTFDDATELIVPSKGFIEIEIQESLAYTP